MIVKNLNSHNVWDYENGYYWFSDTSRISKILYYYELYQMIIGLPGDIFEFGVFKGLSLIRFCQYRDLLENNNSRRIIGFDSFGQFPKNNIKGKDDLKFINEFELSSGTGLERKQLDKILKNKGFKNFNLVKGNVFDTLKKFLKKKPETRISILHLDMDVAEPTEYVLNTLFNKMVKGGLIVIDDYNDVSGATSVVDKFVKEKKLKLEKLNYYQKPSFIRIL